jgi:hypothetical protein
MHKMKFIKFQPTTMLQYMFFKTFHFLLFTSLRKTSHLTSLIWNNILSTKIIYVKGLNSYSDILFQTVTQF